MSVHNYSCFNATLFCAWQHVSADYTAIFRPTYNITVPYYIASNMGSLLTKSYIQIQKSSIT